MALALIPLGLMGLLGVAALKRLDRLDPVEEWAYGIPLGMVVGSLLLLAAACGVGLSTPLVVVLSGSCAGAALRLWPRRRASAAFADRPATGAGMCGGGTWLMSWGAAVVILLLVARWALLCGSALTSDDSGLWAGHVNVWADWSQHLGDVTAFAYGENFPPTHPRFAGHPLNYHYLASVTAAALVRLGLDPASALKLHSFVLLAVVTVGVFAFGRRLTGEADVAGLALVLFLLGGGLGWWLTLQASLRSGHFWAALWAAPWDRQAQAAANLPWQNMVFAFLLPQRPFLYGLPLGLLTFTLLLEGALRGERRAFAAAGTVAGLLPLAHLGTMLALALIAPFLVVAFPARRWRIFFLVWAALAAPQLLLQHGAAALSSLRLQVGWMAAPDGWPWFWLKNLGPFVPLLIWALARPKLVPPPARRFLWAFMPVFGIANLVVFQPWDWDNTKVFVYWYLAGCVLVAAGLARLWRDHPRRAARGAVAMLVVTLVLSGLLENLHQLLGRGRHQMFTAQELQLAREVRARTPPRARFAVGLQHNHPVPVLAGRRVVMSYPGWLWSQGIPYAAREADLRAMFALGPGAPALLDRYAVDYVVIGPQERDQLGADEAAYQARYPRWIEVAPYAVYSVQARH